MVERINPREQNPNTKISFYNSLKSFQDHEIAEKMLKCLAAQFEPIMIALSGTRIIMLEEAAFNKEYAGKNWNHGAVVEIVLRKADGSFQNWSWLLHVFGHELSHCIQMNHSAAFRKLNASVRNSLKDLIAKGFYGRGLYGIGRSLTGEHTGPISMTDLPTFGCGGVRNYKTPSKKKNGKVGVVRRENGAISKSTTSGRQTRIENKPGSRVKRNGAFEGEGQKMSELKEDSTFRKRINSKDAKDTRLMALDRLVARANLSKDQAAIKDQSESIILNDDEDDEDKSEFEIQRDRELAWGDIQFETKAEGDSLRARNFLEDDDEFDESELELLDMDLGEYVVGGGDAPGKSKKRSTSPIPKKSTPPYKKIKSTPATDTKPIVKKSTRPTSKLTTSKSTTSKSSKTSFKGTGNTLGGSVENGSIENASASGSRTRNGNAISKTWNCNQCTFSNEIKKSSGGIERCEVCESERMSK